MSGGRGGGGHDMMPGGGGRGPEGGGWGGPRQPQQPPPPLPNQHWGGGGGGGGGGGPQRWGGGMPGGPGDHDSPNMQRRNPGMEDPHGTSLWGQNKPSGMGPQTSELKFICISPTFIYLGSFCFHQNKSPVTVKTPNNKTQL